MSPALFAWTDDMDNMPNRRHGLLENEDFVFFTEFAGQHQYSLAHHDFLLRVLPIRCWSHVLAG
jgi:hypothetical protein